uniref:Uncharacterized protein n=1 Tax=Oryza punctata TaxID=4537 RepID=A0A0E0MCS7_ORYPU
MDLNHRTAYIRITACGVRLALIRAYLGRDGPAHATHELRILSRRLPLVSFTFPPLGLLLLTSSSDGGGEHGGDRWSGAASNNDGWIHCWFPGSIPKTVSDKEWWLATDTKFQSWPRTAGPPVIMNPISRQNFIVKSTE